MTPRMLAWKWSKNGVFPTAITYEAMVGATWDPIDSSWEMIWKCPVPRRVHHFLWLLVKS
ncbi:hypothetical protein J1N35_003912 [Gossypium stocksii]|uniref:Reverse transcriptase zinc-binding domain-containing protein n=1 Tax=Gossypium stocksii TaxID=47602 RepID=A0A9D4AFJ9_9ROSI|nr:hypothetical protein J1N35_003912 [Gossypium stocksii]